MAANATQANLDIPEYAVKNATNRIPVNDYPSQMQTIPPSRMFWIKEGLKEYQKKVGAGAAVYDMSQGDGGASLPGVPEEILQRAAELQIEHGTQYDNPSGTELFRQSAAEKYWKLEPETGWGAQNIVFAQGGRDGLLKAYDAIISLGHGRVGDLLVVSRVSWISYTWGAYSVGLNALQAPGNPAEGWRYTPQSIQDCVDFAEEDGRKVAAILITSPDNPTGLTLSTDEQIALARAALNAGCPFVIFDWMYHWVTDSGPTDINQVLRAFTPEERERLIFLDGLTKSLGASNIRAAQIVAGKNVIKHISSIATHCVIPGFYAQAVAIAAYEMGFENAAASIIKPTSQSRQILRTALEKSGLRFIMGDGYYAFVDVTQYVEGGGYEDTEELGKYLAEEHGIAVVPGIHFSEAGANWVRLSYALPPEKTEKGVLRFFEALESLRA